MVANDKPGKGLRERLFNKKTLVIIAIAIVVIGAGGGMFLVKASDSPAFCATCHIMKPYYESWNQGNLLAHKHAAKVTCHQCHESSISTQVQEGIKFITGDYNTPIDKLQVSKEFCLKCHSDSGIGTPKGATFEEAMTKTAFTESNPHDSHNGEQDCTVCHSMHEQSKPMCSECHQFNWIQNLDSGWAK